MADKETGGPAFPNITPDMNVDGSPGMTLRDYFAANASDELAAKFVNYYIEVVRTNEPSNWDEPLVYSDYHVRRVAGIEARYRMAFADAMLAEREK